MPERSDRPERPDDLSGGEKLVAQGATVMKFENDQMSAIALAHPRNEAAVKARALQSLEDDPEAAASAYYSIPYKKHSREEGCTGQANDSCPIEEEIEGIGIEGARELARLWRNNASRVYFVEEDDERIWVAGAFVDLETNTRTEVPLGVSRLGVKRGGGVYTLAPNRLAMAIQAGVSKVARNAIVQALPRHLSRAYYERAKEIMAREASKPIDVGKLLTAFEAYGVTRERLEGFFGKKLEELEGDDRRRLRAFFVAVRERLVDPEQFFSGAGDPPSASDVPTPGPTVSESRAGGVNGSPVSGSSATVRGGTEAPAPESSKASEGPAPAGASDSVATAEAPVPEEAGYTGGLAPEPIPEPSPEQKAPKAAPEPGASQPTPGGVDSTKPNEPAEPTQASLEDLGI